MNLKKILSVLLCTVMIFSSITVNAAGIYILKPLDQSNGEQMAEFYDAFLEYVMSEYRYDISREELLEQAVKQVITDHPELFVEFAKGSFNALDENSMFYTQDEYMERFQDVAGVYVGIGINVFYDEDKVILGEAIPGAPAEGSGLSVGDIVVAVDGERVI